MKRLAVALAAIAIAACNPTTKPAAATAPSGDAGNKQAAEQQSTQPQQAQEQQSKDMSVYFDYAQANIDPQYNATIADEASAAKANKAELTLQGNTDERGSAEYNLGLGQRRADAVKKRMVAAGVSGSRIKAVSLGKDKPKASCHDESCWKENRRVDFVQG